MLNDSLETLSKAVECKSATSFIMCSLTPFSYLFSVLQLPTHLSFCFPLSNFVFFLFSPLHYLQHDGFFAKLSSLLHYFLSKILSDGVQEVMLPWQQGGCLLARIIVCAVAPVPIFCLPPPHSRSQTGPSLRQRHGK